MWKYKKFDQKKKKEPKYDESIDLATGDTCEYCSEKPIFKCEQCTADICKTHTKEIKTRYPPYYKNYCQRCYKRHWLIRIISISSTIVVFLIFAFVPEVKDFFAGLGGVE